jgi:hypothetical protein
MDLIQDRFWIWGHEAGSHNRGWGLPAPSRITPVEAAFYMGIPNVIMVRYGEDPIPPDLQYTMPFGALQNVVWSLVGAGGTTADRERAQVLELAGHLPNMSGVMMDDFFRSPPTADEVGVLSTGQLAEIRTGLTREERRLDLWVVLYDHQLALPVERHLERCDKVSFWTWRADDLENLEDNLTLVEDLAPACDKVLGCYMWDYGDKRPMPVEAMEKQCALGLRWLREGRIEGMIFLASCICDLGLETVEWTRNWIASVGPETLKLAP